MRNLFLKKKKSEIWGKYGQLMISLYFLDRIGLHWLFHVGFREITFLKWCNVTNSNSWFLAILNGFCRRFAFLEANIFFLKLRSALILQKSIFHVSNLNVRELNPPTNSCQFDANCGKIWYVSEWPLTRKICNSSATIQSQNKSKTTWEIQEFGREIQVQQKSKVSCS